MLFLTHNGSRPKKVKAKTKKDHHEPYMEDPKPEALCRNDLGQVGRRCLLRRHCHGHLRGCGGGGPAKEQGLGFGVQGSKGLYRGLQ